MLLILIIVSLHIMYLSLWEAHCICVWFYSLFKLQTLQLLSMRKLDLSISAWERKQNWVLVNQSLVVLYLLLDRYLLWNQSTPLRRTVHCQTTKINSDSLSWDSIFSRMSVTPIPITRLSEFHLKSISSSKFTWNHVRNDVELMFLFFYSLTPESVTFSSARIQCNRLVRYILFSTSQSQ